MLISKNGFSSDANFPLKYRIKNEVLYIMGTLKEDAGNMFPNTNTNVFNIPIQLDTPRHFLCSISSDSFALMSQGGQASGYLNTQGEAYIRNVKQNNGSYMYIDMTIPLN